MWGYLGEFWDAVTGAVVEAGVYTADFFYSIGNAVAGAMGGAFDWLLHFFYDTFIFLRWVLAAFSHLFVFITAPVSYFFQFLNSFWLNLTKPPVTIDGGLTEYASSSAAIFQAIPYWETMMICLGAALLIGGAVGIVALFLKLK